jgi:RNA polymerase sigma factor (TIGR02999 family)
VNSPSPAEDREAPAASEVASTDELLPRVYAQLRNVAEVRLRDQRGDHTLQATALVNEVYLRLQEQNRQPWSNDAHFFFAAARAMRDILVEHARARARVKRGGDGILSAPRRAPLDVATLAESNDPDEILALRDALEVLEALEPDVAAVVQLRFFAGLTGIEAARCLGTSPRQVDRHWAYARAWLHKQMSSGR